MRIEYVGKKTSRTDTVAGTGIVWNGAGDVQEVPDEAAQKLLKHADVWAAVGESDAGLADTKPKQATGDAALDDMDAEALHALAKERGVKVHHAAGADKVRKALRDAS